MRELEYQKRGVIWRLASTYGPLHSFETETDICTYWRAVLKGSFLVALLTMWAMMVSAGVADFGAWLVAMVSFRMYIIPEVGAFVIGAILGVSSIAGMIVGTFYLKKSGVHAPQFMTEAYTSWKDKTCVKVNLT
jgi:hypothetical protein